MSVIKSQRPRSPRWRRRKSARPSEILNAALSCFAEAGFAGTRLEDIAARANVTRGTLYLYFRSKEDLFKAVVQEVIVPLFADREAVAAAATGSTAATLQGVILSLAGIAGDKRISVVPKIVLSESRNFPELAKFYLNNVVRRGQGLVRTLLNDGIKRGEFRSVNADQAFFCVMAPILLAMLWEHAFGKVKDGPDLPALCRTHTDLLLHGLLKPGVAR